VDTKDKTIIGCLEDNALRDEKTHGHAYRKRQKTKRRCRLKVRKTSMSGNGKETNFHMAKFY
jgi:hypothetical protein